MDRRIDAQGNPVPEEEIGRTEWTHPETGQVFDLTDRVPPRRRGATATTRSTRASPGSTSTTGQEACRSCSSSTATHTAPTSDSAKRITDGEWVRVADAPKFSQRTAALAANDT